MSETRKASGEFEPLIECATCGKVTGPDNAEIHWVNVQGKPEKVWICKACVRLGRGNHVRKYVMREEKHGRKRT